jgi:hypothetical protein
LETLHGTWSELQADLPFAPVADALSLGSTRPDGDVEVSLGARAGEGRLAAVRGAAGHPFFVVEVIAMLEQEGSLERAGGVVDAPRAETTRSLHVATLRRLSFLPRRCVELLRVAAMPGSEFDVRELTESERRVVDSSERA